MAIVGSRIVEDVKQRQGERHVVEEHIDSLGFTYRYSRVVPAGVDATLALPERAAQLDKALADREARDLTQRAALNKPVSGRKFASLTKLKTALRDEILAINADIARLTRRKNNILSRMP